jgi:hypothetical protein
LRGYRLTQRPSGPSCRQVLDEEGVGDGDGVGVGSGVGDWEIVDGDGDGDELLDPGGGELMLEGEVDGVKVGRGDDPPWPPWLP